MTYKMGILTALASTTIFNGLIAEAMVSSEIEAGSKLLGANLVNEISFDEGKTTLTEEARAEIRSFIKEARAKGQIEEIKVAVWADKDYENQAGKIQPSDVKLSEARAKVMRDYLTNDLALSNVSSYNMSQQPNPLQKIISGNSSGKADDNGMGNDYVFTRVNRSKAILMIYLR